MATKRKVLIVDYDRSSLETLRQLFENQGYQVYTAKDGEEAYALFFSKKPDLVVLEPFLPRLHGFDFLGKASQRFTKPFPLIVLTGFYSEALCRRDYLNYFDDYAFFNKPFRKEEVLQAASRLLNNENQEHERELSSIPEKKSTPSPDRLSPEISKEKSSETLPSSLDKIRLDLEELIRVAKKKKAKEAGEEKKGESGMALSRENDDLELLVRDYLQKLKTDEQAGEVSLGKGSEEDIENLLQGELSGLLTINEAEEELTSFDEDKKEDEDLDQKLASLIAGAEAKDEKKKEKQPPEEKKGKHPKDQKEVKTPHSSCNESVLAAQKNQDTSGGGEKIENQKGEASGDDQKGGTSTKKQKRNTEEKANDKLAEKREEEKAIKKVEPGSKNSKRKARKESDKREKTFAEEPVINLENSQEGEVSSEADSSPSKEPAAKEKKRKTDFQIKEEIKKIKERRLFASGVKKGEESSEEQKGFDIFSDSILAPATPKKNWRSAMPVLLGVVGVGVLVSLFLVLLSGKPKNQKSTFSNSTEIENQLQSIAEVKNELSPPSLDQGSALSSLSGNKSQSQQSSPRAKRTVSSPGKDSSVDNSENQSVVEAKETKTKPVTAEPLVIPEEVPPLIMEEKSNLSTSGELSENLKAKEESEEKKSKGAVQENPLTENQVSPLSTTAQEKANNLSSSSPTKVKTGDLVPLNQVDVPPQVIEKISPKYPPQALRFGVKGQVVVMALISENGYVLQTRLLRGFEKSFGLNEATLEAVRQWRFKPAEKDGVKVKVWKPIAITFQGKDINQEEDPWN
ncbi:MAG TPA: TonB family protein [Candidatus Aminicenantes bacterium]|nr:TonB family protein [Candidatus Aminicenantes bacterium]